MTLYEKIKSMSLEEMADFLKDFNVEDTAEELHYCRDHCPHRFECEEGYTCIDDCWDKDYKECMIFCLNQEC